MKQPKPHQIPIFTKKRIFCSFCGTSKESFILRFFDEVYAIKLSDALKENISEQVNRKGVVFHQDNAIPPTPKANTA